MRGTNRANDALQVKHMFSVRASREQLRISDARAVPGAELSVQGTIAMNTGMTTAQLQKRNVARNQE